jgi:hypothetical protein
MSASLGFGMGVGHRLGNQVAPGTPSPDFTFDGRPLPAGSTFTRASAATFTDFRGYTVEAANDVARFTYDPALPYNEEINPWMDGAAPGVAPSNWGFIGGSAGITRTILGRGDDPTNGPYFDVRFQGTAVGGGFIEVGTIPSATLSPNCSIGTTVYTEMGAQILRGTAGTWLSFLDGLNAAAGFVENTNAGATVGGSVVRNRNQRTMTNANVALYQFGLRRLITNGEVIDCDLRIFFPVSNVGTGYLTDAVPLGALIARIGTTPQYGLLGLPYEEALGYNAVANPRLEGAVAGSPGTVPTGMGFISGSGSGLTRTISIGLEDGQRFIDMRWAGVATASDQIIIVFEGGGALPCVLGQTASGAVNICVFGPNLPPTAVMRMTEINASVFTATDVPVPMGATPLRLRSARLPVTRTFTNAASTNASLGYVNTFTNGVTYDFTVRFQLPQLELNPFPTSVALPPVGVPGGQPRARDVLTLPTSALVAAQGSVSARFSLPRLSAAEWLAGPRFAFYAGDATNQNSISIRTDTARVPTMVQRSNNVQEASFAGAAMAANVPASMCMAWGGGSARGAFNGGAVTEDAAAPSPLVNPTTIRANDDRTGGGGSNIILRWIRFWPVKLSAAQVRAESARVG